MRDTPSGRAYLDLQNRARREKRGTQELLTMYVVERWLARLSRSSHAQDFVLKGGMLLSVFGLRRPTVDADALARNLSADHRVVAARIAEIASLPDPEDGVQFLPHSLITQPIRDEARYAGTRAIMDAHLATAKVKFRLDVNFGDPVTPEPLLVKLPSLREHAEPIHVMGYPLETMLAEKLITAVELGPANTRVRDYCDIYALTGARSVVCGILREALMATAEFRGVRVNSLADTVADLAALRQTAYAAYRRSLGETGQQLPEGFQSTVTAVAAFIDPVIAGLDARRRWEPRLRRWI